MLAWQGLHTKEEYNCDTVVNVTDHARSHDAVSDAADQLATIPRLSAYQLEFRYEAAANVATLPGSALFASVEQADGGHVPLPVYELADHARYADSGGTLLAYLFNSFPESGRHCLPQHNNFVIFCYHRVQQC